MASSTPAPSFLIGVQRTGSTLLRLTLNHHPQLACLDAFSPQLLKKESDGSAPDFQSLKKRILLDRRYQDADLDLDPSLDYHQKLKNIYDVWCRHHGGGKPILGVTMHFRYLLALELWPDAKFIHLVRAPRDAAPSFINLGRAGNAWHATDNWVEAERKVEALCKLIPAERIMRVRFEDLVHNSEKELMRICQLLGTPYSSKMLSYPENTSYKLPAPSAAQRWLKKMSRRDIQLVEARAGDLLGSLGYEKSNYPSLKINGAHRSYLALHNRLRKLRFRIKRHGCKAIFVNAISTRLGPTKASLKQQKIMQGFNRDNLKNGPKPIRLPPNTLDCCQSSRSLFHCTVGRKSITLPSSSLPRVKRINRVDFLLPRSPSSLGGIVFRPQRRKNMLLENKSCHPPTTA